jgi:hypothetical protein
MTKASRRLSVASCSHAGEIGQVLGGSSEPPPSGGPWERRRLVGYGAKRRCALSAKQWPMRSPSAPQAAFRRLADQRSALPGATADACWANTCPVSTPLCIRPPAGHGLSVLAPPRRWHHTPRSTPPGHPRSRGRHLPSTSTRRCTPAVNPPYRPYPASHGLLSLPARSRLPWMTVRMWTSSVLTR